MSELKENIKLKYQSFVLVKKKNLQKDVLKEGHFQHSEARAHTINQNIAFLRECFEYRINSLTKQTHFFQHSFANLHSVISFCGRI